MDYRKTKNALRVLIVDDKRSWQSRIRRLIRRFLPNADIICAANRAEIDSCVARGDPDLITMDGNFEFYDVERQAGPLYVKELRESNIKSPIIMVTNDQDASRDGMINRADACCRKDELFEQLPKILADLKLIP